MTATRLPAWSRVRPLRFLVACGLLGALSLAAAPLPKPVPRNGQDPALFFSLALRRTAGPGAFGLTLDGARHLTKPVFVGVGPDGRLLARIGGVSGSGPDELPDAVRLVGKLEATAAGALRLSVTPRWQAEPAPDWPLIVEGPCPEEALAGYFLDLVNGAGGEFLDIAFGETWGEVARPLADGLAEGRFGRALDARLTVAHTPPRPEFAQRVLTAEAWVKVKHGGTYNILLAHAPKSSDAHWELYTERGNGALAAYIPANKPSVMTSPAIVADDRWHHVALAAGVETIRLYVDGSEVLKAPHTRAAPRDTRPWGLVVGALEERTLRCDGLIDEVRLRHGAQATTALPTTAPDADESTFALWHFDTADGNGSANAVAAAPPVTLAASRPSLDYPTVRQRIEPEAEPFTREQVDRALARFGLTSTAVSVRPGVWRHWGEEYRELQAQLDGRRPLPGGAVEQALDAQALVQKEDADPAGVVLRRVQAMLGHLRRQRPDQDLAPETGLLQCLAAADGERRVIFLAACALRRQLMLRQLDFDRLLFARRGTYAGSRLTKTQNRDPEGGHFANQYFGFNTIPDGGLYVLEHMKDAPEVRSLLAGSPEFGSGAVQGPDLSFDGREIVFAHCRAQEHAWHDWSRDTTWKLCRIGSDGTGLRQLTDGAWNDFDPCWLPDGRIAFVSERRGGFIRCFGQYVKVPNYVLHSMRADGSDIVPLSYYETSEWNPSVDNHGMLVYGRWDYTDRENCLGSNFWTCFPMAATRAPPTATTPIPGTPSPRNRPISPPTPGPTPAWARPYAEMASGPFRARAATCWSALPITARHSDRSACST